MDKSRPEYREGKRRLKRLIGRARAEVRKMGNDMEFVPHSMIGQATMSHLKESKMDALVVYEEGAGKWYADLVFKGLPIGVPSAFGTPTHLPKSSKAEAERDGFMFLVSTLKELRDRETIARDTKPKDERVFELYDTSFTIPGEAIDSAAALAAQISLEEDYTEEQAKNFLQRAVREICGDKEFSGELYDAASAEQQTRLLAAMSTMLIFGEFRYPRRSAEV